VPLDVAGHQLHFEIVAVLLGELVDARKNRLQRIQVGHLFDLLIQTLQLIQRILVLGAHDVYPTLAS
jgi:hypothetical protein